MTDGRHSRSGADTADLPRKVRGIETFGRMDNPSTTPAHHGDNGDPRYPSPTRLRWISAFVVDWLIHAGPMIAVFAIFAHDPSLVERFPPAQFSALVSWPVLSYIDRTVVQRLFHGTIGKLLFGLVVIRPEDGRWPGLGRLNKVWFLGLVFWIILALNTFGNYIGSGNSGADLDFILPTVRRKDVSSSASDVC